MNFEDKAKLIPSQYQEGEFEDDILLDYERAQNPDTELWLFQFPPQVCFFDICACIQSVLYINFFIYIFKSH